MTQAPFLPTGTVTLVPASTHPLKAPQTAGTQSVTTDSALTLALLTATFVASSVAAGITAKAGGGQAGTVLTAANNFVSVCATAADSVVLPVAAPIGAPVYVRNDGTKNAQVYAVTPGTINGVATATGVSLTAATSATYRQSAAGTWTS